MEASSRRESPPVATRVRREPERFDFFQAVRILERMRRGSGQQGRTSGEIGRDTAPTEEFVRFRSAADLGFPGAPVVDVRTRQLRDDANPARVREDQDEMEVAFFGLIGSTGVLPHHYTRLVMECARARSWALPDFLDLFNHRLLSLFYRAWEKHDFGASYERWRSDRQLDSSVSHSAAIVDALRAISGFGTAGLTAARDGRARLGIADEALWRYGGLLADQRGSALGLEAILQDHLGVPVEVVQFRRSLVALPAGAKAALGGPTAKLGAGLVLGESFWDLSSGVRIRLGPLSYPQLEALIPGGRRADVLRELARTYLGVEYEFDFQLLLRRSEVPTTVLGDPQSKLGWTTWLASDPPASRQSTAGDSVAGKDAEEVADVLVA